MRNASRIKFAAVVTTLSIGGLTALGLAWQRNDSAAVTAEKSTVPEARVIHRRKVRTVSVHPKRTPSSSPSSSSAASAPAVSAPAPAATVPVSQPATGSEPAPVSTSTSPSGGGGGEDDEGEHEVEEAEHEGFDD